MGDAVMPEAMVFVFDGGPPDARLVEVEDEHGNSIVAGEWARRGGYWTLTVKRPRLPVLPVLRTCGECGWAREGTHRDHCGHPRSAPYTTIDTDAAPDATCPIRSRKDP